MGDDTTQAGRGSVTSGERVRSSAEVWLRAARAASGFDAAGIAPGDAVALLLRNDIAFFEASLGAAIVGAYAVPINWHFVADEIEFILSDCAPKALVVHRDLLERLPRVLPARLRVLVVETPAEIAAAYGIAARIAGRVAPGSSTQDWDDWLAQHEPWTQASRPLTGSVIYTSGTTGRPRAVSRPPMSPAQLERAYAMVRGMYGFQEAEPLRTVMTGPMYHTAPNGYGLAAFRFGGSVVLLPRFDADELLRLIERHRITHLHLVPTMFVRLLKLPDNVRRAADLSSLRWVAHGAAPCPPHVKQAMIDWWGPVINEYYGSTETGGITVQSSEDVRRKPGSVGRPLPGVELRIYDAQRNPVPRGEVGDVYVRTSALSDFEYLHDPAKRRSVEHDAFVCVGDIGHIDADGYLFLSDRRTDVINSGGVNIYTTEIEAALLAVDGVVDCAVFGIPDDEFGESVCAHVIAAPTAGLTEDGLTKVLRARLSGYKVPRRIVFVAEIPREDSGKVFKRRIRAPYWHGRERGI